ncbi:MAG: glycosyltransferase family 4 protein [[Actinobacillus] rossii]|nr:glycosyltransferase family 4 protein [[Actinobacillus] rossii]MDY5792908.1 glycosyltransferase family 4 protein [[Actinobacillus] rossii]
MKKSIAFFIYDVSLVGGAERISLQLANDFTQEYNVFVFSLFGTNDKPVVELNNNITFIFMNRKIKSIPKNILKFTLQLRGLLKKFKIDILLGVTAGINSIALFSIMFTKVKWLYCEHSNLENQTYGRLHFFRQTLGALFSDKVIVLTERDKNNFIKAFSIKNTKLIVIPNYFIFNYNVKSYNIQSKKIVSVGRLVKIKQFDHIIKISENLFKIYPDWEWHIYGQGELYGKLEKEIKDKNLNSHVRLMGHRDNINSLLGDYSFFVMTSRYEGLPLSILEAQSNGLPVISYDCPTGPSEMITDNENGFLIKQNDTNMLYEKINLLIEDSKLREYFSKNASNRLIYFDKNTVLKKWFHLLSSL